MKLKIFYIFLLYLINISLENNSTEKEKQSLIMVQNIPVDHNIPMIIGRDINKNKSNIPINPIPLNIPIILPDKNNDNNVKIITNTSFKINMTNNDPMCTTECCTGCQVQFQKVIMQKNCIINICKCKLIEFNNETSKENIQNEKADFPLIENNYKLDNSQIFSIPFSSFYFFILFIFLIYEAFIIYGLYHKEISFQMSNETLENEKNKKLREYLDLSSDDEELIEFLI